MTLWVGLCWNYRKGHAAFLSVTQNRQETMAAAKKQVEPHLQDFVEVFDFLADDLVDKLEAWIVRCGMRKQAAWKIIQHFDNWMKKHTP